MKFCKFLQDTRCYFIFSADTFSIMFLQSYILNVRSCTMPCYRGGATVRSGAFTASMFTIEAVYEQGPFPRFSLHYIW